jgi:hypothetical protein
MCMAKAIGTLFRLGPLQSHALTATSAKRPTMRTDTAADWVTTVCRSTRATHSIRDARTAEFKTELARLIKKGLTAGLSSDDIADELTEAGEAWRTAEYDPVGDLIASHRP